MLNTYRKIIFIVYLDIKMAESITVECIGSLYGKLNNCNN